MKGWGVLSVVVVLLFLGGAGVSIADPWDGPRTGVQPAESDSPAEFAYTALRTTEWRGYALNTTARSPNDGKTFRSRKRVDRGDREALWTFSRTDAPTRTVYVNECFEFGRSNDTVSMDYSDGYVLGGQYDTAYVAPEHLDVEVRKETGDETGQRVVLEVTNTTAAYVLLRGTSPPERLRENDLRGNLTVVWNERRGVLDRVEYVQSVRENGSRRVDLRWVDRYRNWDDVSVDRPSWAGYSHREVICDVTNDRP